MTAVVTAGAASDGVVSWHAINWQKAYRNVCRLQARIVKACQAGRWGKVKALPKFSYCLHFGSFGTPYPVDILLQGDQVLLCQ
jgi:hypothetical protein